MKNNPIEATYDETVKSQRLEPESGSDIEEYEDFILSIDCCIQAIDDMPSEDPEGSFGKNYLMFCDDWDIEEGDNIVRNSENYRVIGKKRHTFWGHTHIELTLRKYD
jgi:hypothetical protein